MQITTMMNKTMKWQNLKKNNCPQCGKSLSAQYNPFKKEFQCKCGFRIGEAKYKQIVNSQVVKSIDEERHYRPKDESPDYE